MNKVASTYESEGINSVFIYTHEAHPGENYPHLKSMKQKFAHARDLRDVYNVSRTILLDSLDGACHRAFGSMPNMSWIFNQSGIPVYKSDWSDAQSINNAMVYFLNIRDRRRSGERLTPFQVERLDYRIQDRKGFYQGLERNGPKAVEEFRKVFG